MQRDTLAALLVQPEDRPRRQGVSRFSFPDVLWRQAHLPPKRGGVGLASAGTVCECAFVAGVLACLSYLAQHRALLRAPADLSEACPLPLFDALRLAVAAMGVASATPASAPTLPTLLSASPSPAQRALAEGLWDRAYAVVLGLQSAPEERACVCSAAGAHAGDWLCCMPVTYALRAASRHFQLRPGHATRGRAP